MDTETARWGSWVQQVSSNMDMDIDIDLSDGYMDIDGSMIDMVTWWYNDHGMAMTPHCWCLSVVCYMYIDLDGYGCDRMFLILLRVSLLSICSMSVASGIVMMILLDHSTHLFYPDCNMVTILIDLFSFCIICYNYQLSILCYVLFIHESLYTSHYTIMHYSRILIFIIELLTMHV